MLMIGLTRQLLKRLNSKADSRTRLTVRNATAAASDSQELFRFGVVADVQYADQDDAYNFSGNRLRRYRQSRAHWEQAVEWWREEGVAFIAQLGDFIDGSNRSTKGEGLRALSTLLETLEEAPPALHLLGNHELYNFTRKELVAGIEVPGIATLFSVTAPQCLGADAPSDRPFYSFSPRPGWRICILDPYEISLLQHGGGRPGIDLSDSELDPYALQLCQAHNPNDITRGDFARNLPHGADARWVPFNGSMSKEQVAWLQDTLQSAHESGESTIILSHVVLHPGATCYGNGLTLLWNYDDVLDIMRNSPSPPVAVICGHAHWSGYAFDEFVGTHHITLASPLECQPWENASAIVEVFADDSLVIRNFGSSVGVALQVGMPPRNIPVMDIGGCPDPLY